MVIVLVIIINRIYKLHYLLLLLLFVGQLFIDLEDVEREREISKLKISLSGYSKDERNDILLCVLDCCCVD